MKTKPCGERSRSMRLIFFIIANTFIVANAQNSFGIFAEGGASRAAGKLNPQIAGFTFTIRSMPSAKAGLFYSCIVKDKFTFGTKLLVSTVAAKLDYRYTDSTEFIPYQGVLAVRSLAVGFNPYIGYKYKKFSLHVGMQALYFCGISYNHKYIDSYYGGSNGTTLIQNTYEEEYKGFGFGTGAYDMGLTTGIAYHISKRFTAEANYCHGLHNVFNIIAEDSQSEVVVKSRQLTIGIKYSILVSKKKETKTTEQ